MVEQWSKTCTECCKTIEFPRKTKTFKCITSGDCCKVKAVLGYDYSSQNTIHLSSLWESQNYHRMNVGFLEVECAKHCKTIGPPKNDNLRGRSHRLWRRLIWYDHEKRSKQCGFIINCRVLCGCLRLCKRNIALFDAQIPWPSLPRFLSGSAQAQAWKLDESFHWMLGESPWFCSRSEGAGAGYSSKVYAMQWAVIGSHQNYTDYLTYITLCCIYIQFIWYMDTMTVTDIFVFFVSFCPRKDRKGGLTGQSSHSVRVWAHVEDDKEWLTCCLRYRFEKFWLWGLSKNCQRWDGALKRWEFIAKHDLRAFG